MDAKIMIEQQILQLQPIDQAEIKPEDFWVSYDADLDTMLMYITKHPVPSATFWVSDDVMVLIGLETNKIVGFQIESWEKSFVPSHPDLVGKWSNIKPSLADQLWSESLRIIAIVVAFAYLFTFDSDHKWVVAPQPA